MCELFAVSSRDGIVLNEYLKTFYQRSSRHPHGWGLARLHGREAVIDKEPVQASESGYLKKLLSQPFAERNVLAHIRYATIGDIGYQNCHPYSQMDGNGRCWTLVHNGTIFDYPPMNKFFHLQKGETDSERILLYLVEEVNAWEQQVGRPMEAEERFWFLDSLIAKMAEGNKLNLLLYDGELLYVHTNYKSSLHVLKKENTALFATVPLDEEDWKPVTFTTLLAYRDGELYFQGTTHGKEYFDKAENLRYLYQIFSGL